MKKFAVILSGCGVYDGSEIHEAVMALFAIDKAGASYQCFAPNIPQLHVIDHITGKPVNETRNVLTESARIARGNVKPLKDFEAGAYDGLIIPGGFGAAKNLCNWATKGDQCEVNGEVAKAVGEMTHAGKPVGAMCIAPVILARLFKGIALTTGDDPASMQFIEGQGNQYHKAAHGMVIQDAKTRIFTTPCYMLDASISQIAEGAENLVSKMLKVM